jgi:micrococcal nuclease
VRRPLLLLVVSLAALAVAWGGRSGGEDAPGGGAGGALHGRVVRVVDGDTIRVALGARVERVRYIGIDTPESVKPDAPVQCYAHRAAAENAGLVAGQRVRLVLDVEARDRFGRLLAYVYRARDGVNVGDALVRGGYARTLTIPPNIRFAARFAALARQARRAGRGLWSACGPA